LCTEPFYAIIPTLILCFLLSVSFRLLLVQTSIKIMRGKMMR